MATAVSAEIVDFAAAAKMPSAARANAAAVGAPTAVAADTAAAKSAATRFASATLISAQNVVRTFAMSVQCRVDLVADHDREQRSVLGWQAAAIGVGRDACPAVVDPGDDEVSTGAATPLAVPPTWTAHTAPVCRSTTGSPPRATIARM